MSGIQLHSARTDLKDSNAAADALVEQLGSVAPKLAVLFASRERDHAALNQALRDRLPKETRLIGATTAGEIDNDGMHAGTALLGALTGDFEVGLGLGTELSMDAISAGHDAVTAACNDLGVSPKNLNAEQYVGIVIDDGFQFKKEELLMGMLEPNPELILVGGGAGDDNPDFDSRSALVHVDDQVTGNGVLIALLKTEAPWAALRSHWYNPTGETLEITKVDSSYTRALEIDGKPAAKRYAEILGVTVDDLEFGKPNGFASRPTALKVGREYFLRSPWRPLDDGSILFANLLEEGAELEIMQIGNMVEMARQFLEEELPTQVPSPQAALFFHCEGRKWFAAATGNIDGISDTFKAAPPCIGYNVNFEIYCGFHINTTLTTLVLG